MLGRLFGSKRQKATEFDITTIRSHPIITSKRLILIRHSESVWNDTLVGIKGFYRFEVKRWRRIWGYLFRESVYLPTTKSLFFDTTLTPHGLNLCLSFHDWLSTTQPERDLEGNDEALQAVALLRGPHWSLGANGDSPELDSNQPNPSADDGKNNSNSFTPHPHTVPATMITSHLRRTILTLFLILQTRLAKHHEFSRSSKPTNEDLVLRESLSSGVGTSASTITNDTEDLSTLRNRTQDQQQSPVSPQSTTSQTQQSPENSTHLPSRSHIEQIYINSNCKEMSANIDCISLTKLGELPCFSAADSNEAESYFHSSQFKVNSTVEQKDDELDKAAVQPTLEQILSLSCDMTDYTSLGASTKVALLARFGAHIFDHHNDNFIVCGHSSWFRNFYGYFIPTLTNTSESTAAQPNSPQPSPSTPNQEDLANSISVNLGHGPNHIARVIQDKRMPNASCYSIVMNQSVDPATQKAYFWIDPDRIVPVWRGIEWHEQHLFEWLDQSMEHLYCWMKRWRWNELSCCLLCYTYKEKKQ